MRTTISQRELRNDSGVIMRRVEQGESFTVTRNGAPVADLVPHDRTGTHAPQRFVPVDAIAGGAALLPPWGAEQFAREQRELEASIDDDDVDPWTSAR